MTDGSAREYVTVEADSYLATTVVPYTEGAELRRYELDADELGSFVADMRSDMHGEEIVNIEAKDE